MTNCTIFVYLIFGHQSKFASALVLRPLVFRSHHIRVNNSQLLKQDEAHEPECWHVCWGRKATHIDIVVVHPDMTHWFWHSGRTLLLDTIAQHCCETLLLYTLVGHFDLTHYLGILAGTLLLHTLTWRVFLTRLQVTLTWHSCRALLFDTFVRRSYLTLL